MDIIKQLPALLVVIPLLAAPLNIMLRHRKIAYFLVFAVILSSLAIALALAVEIQQNGIISYHFGNWRAPIGIEFRIDNLNLIVILFVSLSTAISMPWMLRAVEKSIEPRRQYLFYTMMLLSYAGLLGMSATGDVFNLFVFLEISSISTYVMIAMNKDRRAIVASFNYLIMGTIGATFYIIAVGFMYQATGTLNMYDMAGRLAETSSSYTVLIALAFMFTGLGLKSAIFPLHAWLPRCYTFAPDPAVTFLASTATKVSLYTLIRMSVIMFVTVAPQLVNMYNHIFQALGICAMIIGAMAAARQYNLKRILAFSSISQIGYMVLALGIGHSAGIMAAVFHMFNHALLKGLLFMAAGALAYKGLGPWLIRLQGRGRSMPITMGFFIIGGLGLIGIPGTVGFVSKYYLIRAAVLAHNWVAVAAILITSLLAVVYFWRLIEVAYMMKPPLRAPQDVGEAPKSMLISMAIAAAFIIGLGFYNKPIIDIIRNIEAEVSSPHAPVHVPLVPRDNPAEEGGH